MDERRYLTVREERSIGMCRCAPTTQAELCAACPMFETAYDRLVGRCFSDKYYNKLE